MGEEKEFIEDIEKPALAVQKRLSPSAINSYYKCPREYYYTYIGKLKTKPSIHLVKGSIVHKTLEDFFKVYSEDLTTHMDMCFMKALEISDKNLKNLGLSEEEEKKHLIDCKSMVGEYLIVLLRKIKNILHLGKAENQRHAFHILKPKFREKWVANEDIHLGGYIDRVDEDFDGILTLGDYKTSSKFGIGLPEDYRRQLSLYALLYSTTEKTMPDFVSVIFLRLGEEYFLQVSPSMMRYAKDCLDYVWSRTRTTDIEDYPLNESRLCKWCQYFDICSGKTKWEEELRIQNMKELGEKDAIQAGTESKS